MINQPQIDPIEQRELCPFYEKCKERGFDIQSRAIAYLRLCAGDFRNCFSYQERCNRHQELMWELGEDGDNGNSTI